jgi:hypothetical protein
MKNHLVVIEFKQQQQQQQDYQDSLSVFIYALKAPETKRQWLQYFAEVNPFLIQGFEFD